MKPLPIAYTGNSFVPYSRSFAPPSARTVISAEPTFYTGQKNTLALQCTSWLDQFFPNGLPDKPGLLQAYAINWDADFATPAWKENFLRLMQYLSLQGQLPPTSHALYTWAWKQRKQYPSYRRPKRLLLDILKMDECCFRPKWTDRYNALAAFVNTHQRPPLQQEDAVLYKWLKNQKSLYRQQKLDVSKLICLMQLGIAFKRHNGHKDQWEKQYEALKQFIGRQRRWPGSVNSGEERVLYNWYRNQKQAIAGTLLNRKPLPQDKLQKLRQLGI